MSSMIRNESKIKLPAPPPSPIPTAKGSRSAANEILCEYLEKALNVPDLTLPQPSIPLNTTTTTTTSSTSSAHNHNLEPDEIDFRSLGSGDTESLDKLLRSAREVGALRIRGVEILVQPLRSLVHEGERVFRVLEERDMGFGRNSGNREQIVWAPSDLERMNWARDYIGVQMYQHFR